VCAIPATTTCTPAAWLDILLNSFSRSCPIARSLNLAGCDGCRYCRSCFGFHIRLCNLGIIPPRKFSITITKDIRFEVSGDRDLDSLNEGCETIIFETDSRRCEMNVEPPEALSALTVAAPCIQSLDEARMMSDSDVTDLYVFTGHRWILREEWVLMCCC